MNRTLLNVSAAVFGIIALIQIFRIALKIEIIIDGFVVPYSVSLSIFAFCTVLAVVLHYYARK